MSEQADTNTKFSKNDKKRRKFSHDDDPQNGWSEANGIDDEEDRELDGSREKCTNGRKDSSRSGCAIGRSAQSRQINGFSRL